MKFGLTDDPGVVCTLWNYPSMDFLPWSGHYSNTAIIIIITFASFFIVSNSIIFIIVGLVVNVEGWK